MNENPNLKLLVEGLGYLSVIVTSLVAWYGMRARARQNEQAIARGIDPKSLPDINPRPLLLLIAGGALLAYLFARHPEMAQRVLPVADSAELASAMPSPSAASCTSAADCARGCQCTGGQCTPCSAAKPKPQPVQKTKPRYQPQVATLGDWLALPQMYVPVQAIYERPAER